MPIALAHGLAGAILDFEDFRAILVRVPMPSCRACR